MLIVLIVLIISHYDLIFDHHKKIGIPSFKIGWWISDILSLMLYTKFGCHHHHPQVS